MTITAIDVAVVAVMLLAITRGMFIGMILALEGFNQFDAIGLADRMGGIINSSVVKQIGPVLAAVMVAGPSCAAMRAAASKTLSSSAPE